MPLGDQVSQTQRIAERVGGAARAGALDRRTEQLSLFGVEDGLLDGRVDATGHRCQVGAETARELASNFASLAKLAEASQEKLLAIRDIGPVVAKSIYQWFKQPSNQAFLKRLDRVGVRALASDSKTLSPGLKNVSFVFTGELATLTRDQAAQLVRERGGKVSSSISSQTDYLVQGAQPGSKSDQARSLGVTLLDETAFLNLLKKR